MAKDAKHEGLHTDRLPTNPREVAFAEVWAKKNERHQGSYGGHTLLEILLSEDYDGSLFGLAKPVPQHHVTIVATIIQWLGSPIGSDFLQEVEDRVKGLRDDDKRKR